MRTQKLISISIVAACMLLTSCSLLESSPLPPSGPYPPPPPSHSSPAPPTPMLYYSSYYDEQPKQESVVRQKLGCQYCSCKRYEAKKCNCLHPPCVCGHGAKAHRQRKKMRNYSSLFAGKKVLFLRDTHGTDRVANGPAIVPSLIFPRMKELDIGV